MVNFSGVKSVTIPEGSVKKITASGVVLWEKKGFTNLVPLSTEADGKTIYNGGLGYKSGYRIRSGGAESHTGTSSCSGFIPVKPLSIVRVGGCTYSANTQTAINVSDSTFTNLGQMVGNSSYGYGIMAETANKPYNRDSVVQKDNYWEWVVPPDNRIAYIRVTGETSDGSKLIVTVDEEIIL